MSNAVSRMRVIALLEGLSYLALLWCSKITPGPDSEAGVHILGPTHGVLFIVYLLAAVDLRARLRWSGATTVKVLVASVIPFASFVVERWLRGQSVSAARQD